MGGDRTAVQPSVTVSLTAALGAATTQHGQTLLALSRRRPVLLVFLRHFG
jgi:hypothetical protein